MILKGQKFRHFKGGEYEIVALAKDSETQEEVVVYRSLEDASHTWVRPLAEFCENVDKPDIPHKGPRFIKFD